MVKHTQTVRRLLLRNCLNVLDYFAELAFKGLNMKVIITHIYLYILLTSFIASYQLLLVICVMSMLSAVKR